jgi:hypothetical protein
VFHDDVIYLEDCLNSIGRGAPLSLHEADPSAAPEDLHQRAKTTPNYPGPPLPRHDQWGRSVQDKDYSRCDERFQFLPCDLSLDQGKWRIMSSINDLHPVQHRELYAVLQEIINQCVQPWNQCLAYWESYSTLTNGIPSSVEKSSGIRRSL